MKMSRRMFLGTSVAAVAVAACGGDDGGSVVADAAGRNCLTNGTSATISGNHGHVITVAAADVNAGVDKTYDITGTAGHAHSVTVTAANFASLQTAPTGSVMVTSTSGNAHTHGVTILCA